MKRALAARAKEGLPNGAGPASPAPEQAISNGSDPLPSSTTSSSTAPKQPLKITPSSGSTTPSAVSPRPKKRLRESSIKLDEEEEDDSNASSFYLRHQNRALASELRMLKYQLTGLERERDYRRSQSSKAVHNLNSLQATWAQMESVLKSGQPPLSVTDDKAAANGSASAAPTSTGSGTSVELMGALFESLAALGSTSIIEEGDDNDDNSSSDMEVDLKPPESMEVGDTEQLGDLLRITSNVSKRAEILQQWIWSLLQRVEPSSKPIEQKESKYQQKLARLKAKNKTLKAQLKEVARSRDEMSESDKRVRRGLYRLAAGRVKLKEVLKAIVVTDEDKEAAASWMESTPAPAVVSSSVTKTAMVKKSETGGKQSPEDVAQLAELSKQVTDLEIVAKVREDQIKKLISEKEDQLKQINSLILKTDGYSTSTINDDDVRQSDLYVEISTKLSSSKRNVQEMEAKLALISKEWSQALADAEAARQAMEEMQAKHIKRWSDLAEENLNIAEEGSEESPDKKAEEIITLQHKLMQALENVRQAETTRKTLEEAVAMNQSLETKLEEIKGKYSALQAARMESNADPTVTVNVASTLSKPKPAAATSQSTEKSEEDAAKLHREYRKLRKELAAVAASKEKAKAKLAASERERESLHLANSRLLKQAAERDDVNAKSLSTILHLKQLTEQITKERENLEEQVKSSQQVALAARLAANARERVFEEFEKEREGLKSEVKVWEQKYADSAKEKELLESTMLQQKAKMSTLLKDTEKVRQRCDELVAGSSKLETERQSMMESLAVAKREAAEAAKVSESLSKQSGNGGGSVPSGFTVEQLNTQVSVLKSRLACPVCNTRDKKCILLRCRHMFCKECVDVNIKNRSRKCPACGGRFDTKDVADVWL